MDESETFNENTAFKTTKVFKTVEPYVDIGTLLIEDLDPFDLEQYKTNGEEYVKAVARDNLQFLFNKIWELPTERVEEAIVVKLPEVSSKLPREKPIPRLRAATRWERYMNLKGIHKAKKSRMVWSEETQSWQPRWGYKRAKDETKNWVVEIPDQKDPYKDYIGERIEKKKEGVAKNELQRLKNIQNQVAKQHEIPAMPIEQKSSEQLARQVKRATESTASLGKFTSKFKGEKSPKDSGKKRQFLPNECVVSTEKDKQLDILKRLYSKTSPLDVNKAMGKLVQDEQTAATVSKSLGTTPARKALSRSMMRKKSRSHKPTVSKKPGDRKVKKRQTGKRNRSGSKMKQR